MSTANTHNSNEILTFFCPVHKIHIFSMKYQYFVKLEWFFFNEFNFEIFQASLIKCKNVNISLDLCVFLEIWRHLDKPWFFSACSETLRFSMKFNQKCFFLHIMSTCSSWSLFRKVAVAAARASFWLRRQISMVASVRSRFKIDLSLMVLTTCL